MTLADSIMTLSEPKDRYSFMREAYLQWREYLVYDSGLTEAECEEEFIDDEYPTEDEMQFLWLGRGFDKIQFYSFYISSINY